MTVQINYASYSPPSATRARWLVVIIIMIVTWAALVGPRPTAPLIVSAAALAAAVKELVRAGLRHELRKT
jgi:hypothetical protein